MFSVLKKWYLHCFQILDSNIVSPIFNPFFFLFGDCFQHTVFIYNCDLFLSFHIYFHIIEAMRAMTTTELRDKIPPKPNLYKQK